MPAARCDCCGEARRHHLYSQRPEGRTIRVSTEGYDNETDAYRDAIKALRQAIKTAEKQ